MGAKPRRAMNAAEFDKHVERCLSMVLHHEVVRQLAEIAREVFRKRLSARELAGGK